MRIISVLLLIISLILESTFTSIPLVLVSLLVIASLFKDNAVFLLGFLFGILLDLMTLRTIGVSSVLFEIYLLIIFLYQSKLEIATNNFIIVASFLGSVVYLLINHSFGNLLFEPIAATILGLCIFLILKRIVYTKQK